MKTEKGQNKISQTTEKKNIVEKNHTSKPHEEMQL